MNAYHIQPGGGLDTLRPVTLPDPEPGPDEVLIRVRANSLNYRDTLILHGRYGRTAPGPLIPLSDGAGEIIAVGANVEGFRHGDRVAGNFMRRWAGGRPDERAFRSALGGDTPGALAECITLPASGVVRIPDHLSFEEAATLPCAAVTAWNALTAAAPEPGQTLLLLGTGGVSVFGLQLGRAFGLETIVTSSSDEKLARARELGARHTINYRQHPDWDRPVRDLTGGRGVDHVVEVGGPGTLERSLRAAAVGGVISLIGLLDTPDRQPSILPAIGGGITIRGVYVGSTEMFAAMNRAIAAHRIRPVIDRVFPFDAAREAYAYFEQQKHFGKVVITHA